VLYRADSGGRSGNGGPVYVSAGIGYLYHRCVVAWGVSGEIEIAKGSFVGGGRGGFGRLLMMTRSQVDTGKTAMSL